MASGDAVVQVLAVMPPGSGAATLDVRAGGSTPPENATVFDFDASSDEYMDYLCKLEGYGGGGLTFTRPYSMSTATSNGVRIELAIRRMDDDAEDIDAAHSYDYNGATDTVPDASGELSYPTVAFTDGADMDSLAEGELFILREHRDYDHAGDTASGDLEGWGPPSGLET
jgi:hypothetical protein